MNAPTAPSTQPPQRGPVRAYESAAYRTARERLERATIVAALAAGASAREVMAELDREEQGDE